MFCLGTFIVEYTENTEAYQLKAERTVSVEEASYCRPVEWIRELQQAIELDPNYAVQTRTSQIFSDASALRR